MKISIHQQAALIWTFSSTIALSPAIQLSTKSNIRLLLWTGITTVTVMIAIVPLLLKWGPFRKAFCWTDALSTKERKLLSERRAGDFYQAAYDDCYVMRLKPYLIRTLVVVFFWIVLPDLLSFKFENEFLQGILVFSSFYPLAMFILMMATFPYPQVVRAKFSKKL